VKINKFLGAALALGAVAVSAQAQDATATTILTAGTTAFQLVAGLCITIGTFFLIYKLVKRVK